MCMVNMLFRKNISKDILVEIFKRYKVQSMSNYLYVERIDRIDNLPLSEKDVEDEKFKQDLISFYKKTTVEKADIIFHHFDSFPCYNFVGIYSEMLKKRGFTSLGNSEEFYGLTNEDLKYWKELFSSMLIDYKMDDIGIYITYDDLVSNEPQTLKKIKLENLKDRDLVTMEVNRVLFIEK